ncbi:hypothetical protein A6V25_24510 [Nostoc sp. ATCC 53789]|nr:hypothetical protein A6V25_24510 [Nostoc sp. ATCC 53789]
MGHWALGIGHWALGIGNWALGMRNNLIPFLCEAAPNFLLLLLSYFVFFASFAVRSSYSLAHLYTELV